MNESSKTQTSEKEEIIYWNTQLQEGLAFSKKFNIQNRIASYLKKFQKTKSKKIKIMIKFSDDLNESKLTAYDSDISKALLIYIENTIKFWDFTKTISITFESKGISFETAYNKSLDLVSLAESMKSEFLESEAIDLCQSIDEVHAFYSVESDEYLTRIFFIANSNNNFKNNYRKLLEV